MISQAPPMSDGRFLVVRTERPASCGGAFPTSSTRAHSHRAAGLAEALLVSGEARRFWFSCGTASQDLSAGVSHIMALKVST